YRLQGALELLTEPGEFHFDEQAGELYYYPRKLPIEDQRIVVPSVKRVLEVKGSSCQAPARNLIFEGLSIEGSDFTDEYRMPHNNCEYPEAREGLVYMENAEHIAVLGCRLRHSGFSGVMLNGSCRNNRIEGNLIGHIGHNGIYLIGAEPGGGPFKNAGESYTNKLNSIRNNWIRSCGELVGHGSGIQLYQSGDNCIVHNRIHDMPRYGMSVKGLRYQLMEGSYYNEEVTWDNHWDFLHARNNLIAWNDISDVMKDSQDGGMFESWGAGRGNRIIGNRFHHSGIYFSFGFCIYLDDASDDYLIAHNVIHDLFSAGSGVLWFVIFAKGIGSRIENNLLVRNDARAAFGTQEMAGEANRDIAIVRNIACDSGEQLYHFVNWDDSRLLDADYNIFFRGGQEPTVTGIYGDDKMGRSPVPWEAWRKVMGGKFDAHTLEADPLLLESEDGMEFRLSADSPAYALGWETIDITRIGLTDEFPFEEK
ncbi:right-handed parallel beta-helix repeat-containing protein, partial [Paenibacillus sepulcri]|nr:right-handed parallel beta-helix repeat-containing protein [Paenibacillus sepulcri]